MYFVVDRNQVYLKSNDQEDATMDAGLRLGENPAVRVYDSETGAYYKVVEAGGGLTLEKSQAPSNWIHMRLMDSQVV